jgi:F-type H+-transporting ATPase subunit delta
MINISRRRLAEYAADQLLNGKSAHSMARELAAVLIATKKSKDTELLAQDIAWQLESRGALAQAQVTSATELSEALRKEITNFIKEAADVKQVNLQENVDQSVIGGARIETAKYAWDKTLAKQLTDIREAF